MLWRTQIISSNANKMYQLSNMRRCFFITLSLSLYLPLFLSIWSRWNSILTQIWCGRAYLNCSGSDYYSFMHGDMKHSNFCCLRMQNKINVCRHLHPPCLCGMRFRTVRAPWTCQLHISNYNVNLFGKYRAATVTTTASVPDIYEIIITCGWTNLIAGPAIALRDIHRVCVCAKCTAYFWFFSFDMGKTMMGCQWQDFSAILVVKAKLHINASCGTDAPTQFSTHSKWNLLPLF